MCGPLSARKRAICGIQSHNYKDFRKDFEYEKSDGLWQGRKTQKIY